MLGLAALGRSPGFFTFGDVAGQGGGWGAAGGGRGRLADTDSGPGGYSFGARMCIDLRGIQVRVRMCGSGPRPFSLHIRDPNV